MRVPYPVLIVWAIGILVDIYVYRRMRCHHVRRGWCVAYVVLAVLCGLALPAVVLTPKGIGDDSQLLLLMWTLFSYFTVYLPKYIFTLFSLAGRLAGRILHRNTRWVGIAGAVLGAAVFLLMWEGVFFGRFDTRVREVEVEIPGLPAAFDGYRIVQFSDIHVGSYGGDTAYMASVVDEINAMRPDVILFTGDAVNRHSAELRPFAATLGRLRAPGGVWSVMGNHDYGDYYEWPSEQAHAADPDSLREIQRGMGWHVLDNAHAWLRAGRDSVALIGVENIGDPPFKCYGSLDAAYPHSTAVKILMTHNPQHWVDSVADRPGRDIALTLSGHTHAMQMELFGLSPAAWRYPTWGGLYSDRAGHKLYVNIGLGEVALPARIGQARPEITLITLRPKP